MDNASGVGAAEYPFDNEAGPLPALNMDGGPPMDLGATPTGKLEPALGGLELLWLGGPGPKPAGGEPTREAPAPALPVENGLCPRCCGGSIPAEPKGFHAIRAARQGGEEICYEDIQYKRRIVPQ